MTRDQLRQALLAGADRLLTHTRLISRQDLAILRAQRSFWAADDGTQLDRLLARLQENAMDKTKLQHVESLVAEAKSSPELLLVVDGIFAAIEAKLIGHPFLIGALRVVNQIIDSYLSTHNL